MSKRDPISSAQKAANVIRAQVFATDDLPAGLPTWRAREALLATLKGITEGRCPHCLGPSPACQCSDDE